MVPILLSFCGGSFLSWFLPTWHCYVWVVLLVIVVMAVWCFECYRLILLMLLSVLFSIGWAQYAVYRLQPFDLSPYTLHKKIIVEGQVANLPHYKKYGVSFILNIKKISQRVLAAKSKPVLVRLNWYGRYPWFMVGDTLRVVVHVKSLRDIHHRQGFDYRHWLFLQGISAAGYVIPHAKYVLRHRHNVHSLVLKMREYLLEQIRWSDINPQLSAILAALTVGARSLMQQSQWQIFQLTGTSHLIAISGLHVGLVASVIYFLTAWCWRRVPWLCLRWPAPRVAALSSLIFSILYGLLAGFSLPTERAVIMIAMVMIASLFYRWVPMWRRLLLAFSLILFLQPQAVWSASFWLSFSAVACLAYVSGARLGTNKKLYEWLHLQGVIFIGLLPLSLFYFKQVSLVMMAANLIAIPWVSMVIVPLCLLAALLAAMVPPLTHVVWWLVASLLQPLWAYLRWLAALPGVIWFHPINSLYVLILSILGVLILLAPKGWPGRMLGLVLLFSLYTGIAHM